MKTRTFPGRTLPLFALVLGLVTPLGAEESSIHIRIPNPIPHIAKGMHHVGNFFFRAARTLEGAEDPEELHDAGSPRYPPSPPSPKKRKDPGAAMQPPVDSKYRSEYRSAPTRYYETDRNVAPPPQPSNRVEPPTSPGGPSSDANASADSMATKIKEPSYRPMTPSGAANSSAAATKPPGGAQPAADEEAAKPAPPPNPGFAKPVPGRPGLVYPPGMKAAPENMIDVRGIAPGTKVRDPVSGIIFLVP